MMTPSLPLLRHAQEHGYAIPAFNVNHVETILAITEAAVAAKSPIILQTSEGAVQYAGMSMLIAMVRVAAESPIPVVLNFDHGKDMAMLKQAIESGYTSAMIDASDKPYSENVRLTRQVVQWARAHGVTSEAELGRIPGAEDKVNVLEHEALLTDPAEAVKFVRDSECDSLAVAIGTHHGAFKFKGESHLDIARLKKIRAVVDVPLVLHGASGVREDVVALAKRFGGDVGEMRGVMDKHIVEAIKQGITKINIDTDMRLAFSAGLREAIAEHPNWFDPRKLFEPGRLLMKEVAKQKMELFGSAGQAPLLIRSLGL